MWSTLGLAAVMVVAAVQTWGREIVEIVGSGNLWRSLTLKEVVDPEKGIVLSGKVERPVDVQAAAARVSDVPVVLAGIGTVQALNTVAIRSRIDGEMTAILFREGQDVKVGQPLATIDSRAIQAQVDQQEAALLKDQALLEGASLDLHRYEDLATKNFASAQQVDQQRALVAQYRAQTNADAAQISFARTQLDYTTITSPIAGRTGVRMIDLGNFVRAGGATPIVVVSQLQPISVVFALPAASVAAHRLAPGETEIPVTVLAPDGRSTLDRGTVDLIDNQVDQSTGTIKLKATFPNADLQLWPGNYVEGRLTVDTRHDAVTVPQSALRHGPRGDFVFIVAPDNTARIRNVTAGQVTDGRVLIDKGLAGGDLVVTEGQLKLDNGTPVVAAASDQYGPTQFAGAKSTPSLITPVAGDRGR